MPEKKRRAKSQTVVVNPTKENGSIGKHTLVPIRLGLAISILAGVVMATWWVSRRLLELDYKIESINRRIDDADRDQWSKTQQAIWLRLLEAANDGLKVPDVN